MKKPFERITVFVQYRMVGDGMPEDRLVRARVIETLTHRGGLCRELGRELIAPRKLTDRQMSQVHTICLSALRGLANRVVFQYEPLMAMLPEEYPIEEGVA
jgi:hypothetical protein